MAELFLSYSRKDIWIMRTLRAEFEKHGFDVWADEEIESTEEWWQHTIAGQLELVECVIVIVTEHTKGSSWIERELQYARNNGRKIITVLAAGDEKSIPFSLVNNQYVDIRSDFKYGTDKLISSIRKSLSSHKSARWYRTGSLYWLGADLGQLFYEAKTGHARLLKRFLRQVCHHAQRLELNEEIQASLRLLRDSTLSFTDDEWTSEERRNCISETERILGAIGEIAATNDREWEPFDRQNLLEGLV